MKKKRGRPPTRPHDLEAFKVLLTPKAKRTLKALKEIDGRHGYVLIEAAFWDFFSRLPRDKREAAEAMAEMIEAARAKVDEPHEDR